MYGSSIARRVKAPFVNPILDDMSDWLDDDSLGDLWEKNRIGARP